MFYITNSYTIVCASKLHKSFSPTYFLLRNSHWRVFLLCNNSPFAAQKFKILRGKSTSKLAAYVLLLHRAVHSYLLHLGRISAPTHPCLLHWSEHGALRVWFLCINLRDPVFPSNLSHSACLSIVSCMPSLSLPSINPHVLPLTTNISACAV